jgi:hypothetical protein
MVARKNVPAMSSALPNTIEPNACSAYLLLATNYTQSVGERRVSRLASDLAGGRSPGRPQADAQRNAVRSNKRKDQWQQQTAHSKSMYGTLKARGNALNGACAQSVQQRSVSSRLPHTAGGPPVACIQQLPGHARERCPLVHGMSGTTVPSSAANQSSVRGDVSAITRAMARRSAAMAC